ncbi:hypothetical protein DPX16_1151 [Anabarilius grahami]|uniref:Uncharacterized protein n=1 Tax=Anabarilius grahami TaxID=495550 RepID=A0A3N0XZY2_ANAGA|nr:hypothetical protein DPX16_1151 [Anabarilius grahami]
MNTRLPYSVQEATSSLRRTLNCRYKITPCVFYLTSLNKHTKARLPRDVPQGTFTEFVEDITSPTPDPEPSQPPPQPCTELKEEPESDMRTEPTIAPEPEPHSEHDQLLPGLLHYAAWMLLGSSGHQLRLVKRIPWPLHQPSSLSLHLGSMTCRLHLGSFLPWLHLGPSSLWLHWAPSSRWLHLGQTSLCLRHGLPGLQLSSLLLCLQSHQCCVDQVSTMAFPSLDSTVGHCPSCTLGPRLATPALLLAPPTFITTLVSPIVTFFCFLPFPCSTSSSRDHTLPPPLDYFYGAKMRLPG